MLASRAVSAASVSAIAATLAGERIFPAMGLAVPDFVKALQASKLQSCAAAWFLGNMVTQNLAATGAFEVYYDGATLFSKLKSGATPVLPEIVRLVGEAHAARVRAGGAPPPRLGAAA